MNLDDIKKMGSYIPVRDLSRIIDTYEHTPHPGLNMSPSRFVGEIEWRVYTEWIMDAKPLDNPSFHIDYKGQPLNKFLNNETHFAIWHQAHYHWDGNKFKGLKEGQYDEFRNIILDAFVRYAIEFFSHPEQYKDAGKNL